MAFDSDTFCEDTTRHNCVSVTTSMTCLLTATRSVRTQHGTTVCQSQLSWHGFWQRHILWGHNTAQLCVSHNFYDMSSNSDTFCEDTTRHNCVSVTTSMTWLLTATHSVRTQHGTTVCQSQLLWHGFWQRHVLWGHNTARLCVGHNFRDMASDSDTFCEDTTRHNCSSVTRLLTATCFVKDTTRHNFHDMASYNYTIWHKTGHKKHKTHDTTREGQTWHNMAQQNITQRNMTWL